MQWSFRRSPAPAPPVHQVRPQPYELSAPQAIAFPSYGGDPYGQSLEGLIGGLRHPGSTTDWAAEVKDLTLNYAVAGCLRWIADNISEPCPQVVDRQAGGKVKPRDTHPLIDLLMEPNADYDGDSLLTAAAWDYALTGRAYWIKERDNLGRVRSLWWAPWWAMAPRWPSDGSQFITDYLYRPNGTGRGVVYRKEDVVHFRWGLDARSGGRLGVHRTRPFLPAIAATNEGMIYTPSILRNMGIVPNVMVVRGKVGKESREGLKEWFQNLFTGDGRGRPGVLEVDTGANAPTGGVADLKQLGLSPEDLTLDTILDRPEIIICAAAFGIHPGVFFLGGAGSKGFDNGGQLEQARKGSYHDCLVPMLKRFGKTISRSLLPEFEADPRPSEMWLRYDFSEVEALQEDQNALHQRLDKSVQAGWMRVGEAREKARLPVSPEDNVYLRQSGVMAVEEANDNLTPGAAPLDLGEDEESDDPDEMDDADDGEGEEEPEDAADDDGGE